jgi:hypothetical protein
MTVENDLAALAGADVQAGGFVIVGGETTHSSFVAAQRSYQALGRHRDIV